MEQNSIIKTAAGDHYFVPEPLDDVVARLSASDEFVLIEGAGGREDFFLNPLQVTVVYPAQGD